MEGRPGISLPITFFDKCLGKAGSYTLLILWALTLFAFFTLPHIVPIHYSASGKVDNYGSKFVLFCLPVLGSLLFWLLNRVGGHTGVLNHLNGIAGDDAGRQRRLAMRMLGYLKFVIAIIFTVAVLFSYLTIRGKVKGLGPMILPWVPVLILVPAGYYIFASLRKNKASI